MHFRRTSTSRTCIAQVLGLGCSRWICHTQTRLTPCAWPTGSLRASRGCGGHGASCRVVRGEAGTRLCYLPVPLSARRHRQRGPSRRSTHLLPIAPLGSNPEVAHSPSLQGFRPAGLRCIRRPLGAHTGLAAPGAMRVPDHMERVLKLFLAVRRAREGSTIGSGTAPSSKPLRRRRSAAFFRTCSSRSTLGKAANVSLGMCRGVHGERHVSLVDAMVQVINAQFGMGNLPRRSRRARRCWSRC